MSVTTAKYAHCEVCLLNRYNVTSSGSAQNWRMTVAMTRELISSEKYAAARRVMMPRTMLGIVSRLDWVVLKPRLRRESVK